MCHQLSEMDKKSFPAAQPESLMQSKYEVAAV
jgi:hypothetical protein